MSENSAPVYAVFRQSLADAWAGGRGSLTPLTIFTLAVFLLALNWPTALGRVKPFIPSIFLILGLLIALMQTERIFQEDFEDGSLSLWASTTEMPLSSLALAKIFGHWLVGFIPLSLGAVGLSVPFGWSGGEAWVFFPIMALFGLGVYCLGGVVGALTIATKRNAALIALLILPLTLPLFIYASSFLLSHDSIVLGMLVSSCLFVVSTTPFLVSLSLRMALS